jgi:molecular chaperone DnaK
MDELPDFSVVVVAKDASTSGELASDLVNYLALEVPTLRVVRRSEKSLPQGFGATLTLILGTTPVTAVAKGIGDWLARREDARVWLQHVISNSESRKIMVDGDIGGRIELLVGNFTRVAESISDGKKTLAVPVGVRLGSSNSSVGVIAEGGVQLVPNVEGSTVTPSAVAFLDDGEVLIGAATRSIDDDEKLSLKELSLGSNWSFGDPVVYRAEDLAGLILRQLAADVEALCGESPLAVIAVPASFRLEQHAALITAAVKAGLSVAHVITEPTAAAAAYGLAHGDDTTALILDLGAGTFDVSLIEIRRGVVTVRASANNRFFGGANWDERLAIDLAEQIQQQTGVVVAEDPVAHQRLKAAAEIAKIELSSTTRTTIRVDNLAGSDGSLLSFVTDLTRGAFERVTREVLEECQDFLERVMTSWLRKGINWQLVDHVIFTGGASQMPAVVARLQVLTRGKLVSQGLLPDGVVTGATLQAGVLQGRIPDALLLDTTSEQLGIETADGGIIEMIPKGSAIPIRRSRMVTTQADDQTLMIVRVLEGDDPRISTLYDSSTQALIELTELLPIKSALRRMEILLDLDANGRLQVTVEDHDSQRRETVIVSPMTTFEARKYTRPLNAESFMPILVAGQC